MSTGVGRVADIEERIASHVVRGVSAEPERRRVLQQVLEQLALRVLTRLHDEGHAVRVWLHLEEYIVESGQVLRTEASQPRRHGVSFNLGSSRHVT